jgi:uncharacterized protein (TIGR02996 family)
VNLRDTHGAKAVSDATAFLTAMRSNPAEDTPRLVFADWLQEHGNDA